jgi:hypothetical protein
MAESGWVYGKAAAITDGKYTARDIYDGIENVGCMYCGLL